MSDRDMVRIPSQVVELGLPEERLEAFASECADRSGLDYDRCRRLAGALAPSRMATVREFEIMRRRVTYREYAEFLAATGRGVPPSWPEGRYPDGHGDRPVTGVSHKDAFSYAHWLGLSLPTEEQWEVAAGAGDRRRYPWGNLPPPMSLLDAGQSGTAADLASPLGVQGLLGMSWEWCAGVFEPLAGTDELAFRAAHPGYQSYWFALRGGPSELGWAIFNRSGDSPSENTKTYGFRCARY